MLVHWCAGALVRWTGVMGGAEGGGAEGTGGKGAGGYAAEEGRRGVVV